MTALVIIIAIAVVAVSIYFATKKKKSVQADRTQQLIDSLIVQTVTTAGVFVLSRKELTQTVKEAIDGAFFHMQVIATRLNYTNRVAASDYTILIFPSERDYNADGVYCPSFKVYFNENDSYDESIWDKQPGTPGGYTLASEWVVDLEGCRFAMAESENDQFVRDCVHYGLDHLYLYFNDRERYEATKSHADGTVNHPILT